MAKRKSDRTIFTPRIATLDFAVPGEKLVFWKQILPKRAIKYKDKGETRVINFNDEYFDDCLKSFQDRAIDQTMFQLANSDNSHGRDFDPERQRAEVIDMAKFDDLPDEVKTQAQAEADNPDGLWAKMRFFNKRAAKSVQENPKLGVSARVRENFERVDGKFIKRAVIHVLGTIDPRVTGMSAWQAADLSYDPGSGYVLDLSESHYEGNAMAKNSGKGGTAVIDIPTEEEIEAMTDEELEAYLAEGSAEGEGDEDTEGDEDEGDGETDDDEGDGEPTARARETTGASLSNKARKAIDLANAQAAEAHARANQALKRQAKAEFRAYRSELIAAGVPAGDVDLAQPVLERADPMVVDLSNFGETDIDVTDIVRKLLEARKGTVDMSEESGHNGVVDLAGGENDPDTAMLDEWESQFPSN